ncbi:MAG: porin [Proteobacteria bacterium]|uniref:porin n=1 Tax=Acinetobacter venetianus TaxID=52133 RepID=UPI0010A6B0D2|nr:porin [Acinetobacter venetianus]MCR4531490.1 porin [Acinetobacter venetianus]MDA0697421.1 porin [Pseudomonadota bacterium]
MKMKIALATMLSIATASTFAAPKFYGEIDASLDYLPEINANSANHDVWKVNSNSSYLGIKGEEKLSEHLSAVYLAEWAFYADGDKTDWSQRNRFIGLKDERFGTIKLGKHNTPLKELSSPVDSFNNYISNKADITGIMPGENRVNNVVVYDSPEFNLNGGNLEATVLLASGESQGIKDDGHGGVNVAGRGLGDAWSAALSYTHPLFLIGLGYDKAIPSDFLGDGLLNSKDRETQVDEVFAAANTVRLIGRLKPIQGLTLKALFQNSKVADKQGNDQGAVNIDNSQGLLIGAEYKLPQHAKWTVKAQYSQNSTSFKNNDADYDAKQLMVGTDYAFNKQVKLYGYAGYSTFEQANAKDKQPVVGSGLEFKF